MPFCRVNLPLTITYWIPTEPTDRHVGFGGVFDVVESDADDFSDSADAGAMRGSPLERLRPTARRVLGLMPCSVDGVRREVPIRRVRNV
jgi:hypothetical protein